MIAKKLPTFRARSSSGARMLGAVALLALAVTLPGCGRRARVLDVHDHPAVLASGMSASSATTHAAILKALNERGYQVLADDGRVVVARVSSGDVWAVMRIEARQGGFSISHADTSPEFLYDAERGTVHRRYNRWVSNLRGTIDDVLSKSDDVLPMPVALAAPPGAAMAKTAPVVLPPPQSGAHQAPAYGAPPSAPPAPAAAPPSAPPQSEQPTVPPEYQRPATPRPPGAIDI